MTDEELQSYMQHMNKKASFFKEWDNFFYHGFLVFAFMCFFGLWVLDSAIIYKLGFLGFTITGAISMGFGSAGLSVLRKLKRTLEREYERRNSG